MATSKKYLVLTLLCVVAFGVLMALRSEVNGTGARAAVATVAGVAFGLALLCVRKASLRRRR